MHTIDTLPPPAAPEAIEGVSTADWTRLCQVMNGYIYSQTLATACELDLFRHLEANPGVALPEIASALGISAHAARVLMLATCACGLAFKDPQHDGYHNAPFVKSVLLPDAPYSMLDFVRFNHEVQQRCCRHLTTAMREGRNAGLDEFSGEGATLYARLRGHPDLEALFQRAMGEYTRLSATMLQVPDLGEVDSLLDVGGGDGSVLISLCRRHPRLRASLIDLPSVVAIAGENVARAGLSDRIACVARDMFKDSWPEGHDAVLLSHVVEIFSPEKVCALYRRAHAALAPGGRLIVWTLMADDTETSGLQAAKSSIYFLSTASGEGMAYPARDHQRWLTEAGFSSIRLHDARDIDHGALVAIK